MKKILNIVLSALLIFTIFVLQQKVANADGTLPTPSTAIIALDSTQNPVLKTPGDFRIGKAGTKNFNIVVKVYPVRAIEASHRAMGIILPNGFTMVGSPTTTLTRVGNTADGKGVLYIHKYADGVDFPLTEFTITIEQNAEYLLSNLTVGDKYDFIVNNYYNYGQTDETIDSSAKLTLVPDATDAITSIEVSKGTIVVTPHMLGSTSSFTLDSRTPSIADDYHGYSTRKFVESFEITIKKEKGYLPTDLLLTLPDEYLPIGLRSQDVVSSYATAEIYVDGDSTPYRQKTYSNAAFDVITTHDNLYPTNILSYAHDWRTRKGKTDTLVDEIYNATELKITISVVCNANSLDFKVPSSTYTSAEEVKYSYTDFTVDKNTHTGSAGDLIVKAQNGTILEPSIRHLSNIVSRNTEKFQRFDETKKLSEVVLFPSTDGYGIHDNFKIVHKFEEAYSPLDFPTIVANEDANLTYTIVISNPITNSTRNYVRNPGEASVITQDELNLGENEYVSSVVITSPRLWYAQFSEYSGLFVANYGARKTSIDGNTTFDDGDGTYVTHMTQTITSDNMLEVLNDTYSIKLIPGIDNLKVTPLTAFSKSCIVNENNKVTMLGRYSLIKSANTMTYGLNGDEMPELVITGKALELADSFCSSSVIELTAYQDNNGVWHDIKSIAKDYITNSEINHYPFVQNTIGSLTYYDMKKIMDATENGGSYIKAVKYSLVGINDVEVVSYTPTSTKEIQLWFGASKVCPDYLNYNEVFGGKTVDQLPAGPLEYNADIDCNWSGETEDVENVIDTKHAFISNGKTPNFINGTTLTDAQWKTLDNFYLPYCIKQNSAGELHFNCLGSIEITETVGITTMNYHNAYVDFDDTDPDLLALTEYILVYGNDMNTLTKLNVEYTTKKGNSGIKYNIQHCTVAGIPHYSAFDLTDLLVDEEDYFTSLKAIVPEDLAYGYELLPLNEGFPDFSLGRNSLLPAVYPVSGIPVGTKTNVDNEGSEYDRLSTKAVVYAEDIFGNKVFEKTIEGYSIKLNMPTLYANGLKTSFTNYSPNVIYQGQKTQFSIELGHTIYNPMFDTERKYSPVYYFKIASDFVYNGVSNVNDWALDLENDSPVKFVEAGLGPNQSGDANFGYLIIDMSKTDKSKKRNEYFTVNFQLLSKGNTKLGTDRVPVSAVWMDIAYDRNHSNFPEQDYLVDTMDTVDGAPYGDAFGNTPATTNNPAKLSDDGKAQMFYADLTKTMTVNKSTLIGISDLAKAEKPLAYGSLVTSYDFTAVENIFDAQVFISGSDSVETTDWVLYLPVPQKGASTVLGGAKYTNGYGMDLMAVDTSKLDTDLTIAGVSPCIVEYTTNATPSMAGATGGADPAGEYSATVADMSAVTMVRVTIPKLPASMKGYVYLDFKLEEDKSVIGTQHAYFSPTGNAKLGEDLLVEKGFAVAPVLDYQLSDFTITGFVWNETDYNSLRDNSYTSPSNIVMGLFKGAVEVDQTKKGTLTNSAYKTDSSGAYTLYAPTDGEYNVKVTLPTGKKLVLQFVDTNGQDTHNANESWFNRTTAIANVTVEGLSTTNINAGIYNKPIITVPDYSYHVTTTDNEITTNVTNVPTGAIPTTTLKEGEATDVVTVTDQGDGTALVDANKVGTVTCVTTITDGYGETETVEFDLSVYANVIYDVNTGTGSAPTDNNNYELNDEVTVKAAPSGMKKDGYHFSGWNTAADGSGTEYSADDTFDMTSISSDVTLYAQWERNTNTVTYNLDGGNIEGNTTIANKTGVQWDDSELLPTGTPVKNNATFIGWFYNTTEVQTTSTYGGLAVNTTVNTIELKAKWRSNVTVTNSSSGMSAINKALTGSLPTTGVNFAFTIAAGTVTGGPDGYSEVPMPTNTTYNISTATGTDSATNVYGLAVGTNKSIAIGDIVYSEPGTYTYNISETSGAILGVTYDKTNYVMTVVVGVNSTNTALTITSINFTKSVDKDGIALDPVTTASSIMFVNNYTPVSSNEYDIADVNKTITGPVPTGEAAKEFNFKFEAVSTTATGIEVATMPLPDNETITIEGEGTNDFGSVTFTKVGTYVYKITEDTTTAIKGYTFDPIEYTLTIVVVDDGGQLTVQSAVYTSKRGRVVNNIGTEILPAIAEGTVAETITFNNVYAPLKTTPIIMVDPPIKKVVTGNPTTASQFTFKLKATSTTATGLTVNTMPMPTGSENGEKTVIITGSGSSEFGTWEYTIPGTYVYEVSESNTGVENYTYDTTVYTITDVVTDVEGQLTLERTVKNANNENSNELKFTNRYSKPQDPDHPQTGDESNIGLWGSVMGVSLSLLVALEYVRRKEEKVQEFTKKA